uniref:Uncharacterized protein n=1 Tax=viral metagenome TaxID=1070528 RepID=A0A6C0HVG7_9ZZZZ
MNDEEILKKCQEDIKTTKKVVTETKELLVQYTESVRTNMSKSFEVSKKEIKDLLLNYF